MVNMSRVVLHLFFQTQFKQNNLVFECVCVCFSHHLIVLLRFGWLTVLSSMKIVEQELYFFDSGPGDTFGQSNSRPALIRMEQW